MASRLDCSVQAMAEVYPQFAFQELTSQKGTAGVWRGRVRPIKTAESLSELLDDLHHDREVYVVGDEVRHLPSCPAQHCRHDWMDRLGDIANTFDLEIRYDGGQGLPRAWVMAPAIPPAKRQHMWSDNAVCAFLASDRVWVWHKDTVAQFVPHILIWLVKWTVFDRTGQWIGAQHGSTPQYHLRYIRPKDPCWCGSGKSYRKCCRKKDLTAIGLRHARRK